MDPYWKFWASRVGCALLGVYGLFWSWALATLGPRACQLASPFSNFVVCGFTRMLGNVAASVLVFLQAILFFYLALRPARK